MNMTHLPKQSRLLNVGLVFLGILTSAIANDTTAQTTDDWAGLRRSTYDTDDATLRIPCIRVTDSNGNQAAGLAPAYSINLVSAGASFNLGQNLRALEEIPSSCLDTLTLSSDGTTASYKTSSAQIDSDAALFRDNYFTIELSANLASNPASFSVVTATSRTYARAGYQSDALLILLTDKQQIFDNTDLEEVGQEVVRRLVVSEPGVYDAVCRYKNLSSGVLELIDSVNGNSRYRINQNLTSANNGSAFFEAECDIYNRDLNLFETRLERIATWVLSIP